MLQTSAATGRGTASAVRWLVRALLVVAGALLGTAAAWLISDATASATQLAPAPAADSQSGTDEPTPVTDRVVTATDDLTWGASDLVGNATATALKYGMAGGPANPARGEEAASDLGQTIHSFTRDAVLRPIDRTLGTAEQLGRKPQDAPQVIGQALTPPPAVRDFGGKVWDLLHPNGVIKLPSLGGLAAGQDERPVAFPAADILTDPAAAAVMGPVAKVAPEGLYTKESKAGQRGSDAGRSHGHQRNEFPYSPLHGPLAPAGVPSVPGGATIGGHIDGLLFGVPAGGPAVRGADDLSAVRIVSRHTPVQPGEQPGVTPD